MNHGVSAENGVIFDISEKEVVGMNIRVFVQNMV